MDENITNENEIEENGSVASCSTTERRVNTAVLEPSVTEEKYFLFKAKTVTRVGNSQENDAPNKEKEEEQPKEKKGFFAWIKKILPSKRKLIQLYSALLFNSNLKGFTTGYIYQGPTKNLCTPGLNCYSCPGATTACPLGSLQNAMTNSDKSTIFYILGILLLYAIIAGRWICGWLCPFGLIQEVLYKIKTPKAKKSKFTRVLSYLKYVILVVFCIVIPLLYVFKDTPLPGFCKYICPAGTLEGAIGL